MNVHKFRNLSALELWLNRAFGVLAGLGLGLRHNYLLIVTGRKTGRRYSTPVNLLEIDGTHYLVAPRGETQWVRNVRSSGELDLKRGKRLLCCRAEEVADSSKPELLKEYLARYRTTVQRYFSVTPDAPISDFAKIASSHPVFRLAPRPETSGV